MAKWKRIQKLVKKEVKSAHDKHVEKSLEDPKRDSKNFWKYIKNVRKESHNIPPLKGGEKLAETNLEKAEILNRQFSSVFTRECIISIPYQPAVTPRMENITVLIAGVCKLLKNLDPTKACGPDEIHPKVLIEIADEIAPVIAHLFQQSLNNAKIPKDWSLATICPIYKKGDTASPKNYRPVSLTSVLCKMLEHIVCSNIMKHLEEHSIITDRQHAFRKYHSCETQLCTIIDDWAKELDKGNQTDIFFLDFEKAFDTVPHELLKSKLHQYGITGKILGWIDSFLSQRKQQVRVNGECSDWSNVASGVPQGTVLGPLLFSLYINDIINDVDSEIRLFADDCVCYRTIKNTEDCRKLQEDINKLGNWARNWGMRFQPSKCSTMQLTRNRSRKINNHYSLEDVTLDNTDCTRYLGVTISNDLKWNSHINKICTKGNQILGLLRRNLTNCSQAAKEMAYKGLVRPILEYASTAWDPYHETLQKEVEQVQRRAARFVTSNYNYETGSMTNIMNSLNWKTLQQRRIENRLVLLYKGLKGKAKIPINDLHGTNARGRYQRDMTFNVPYARTDIYKNSFIPRTIRDWNKLPQATIQNSENAVDEVKKFTELIRSENTLP